MSNNYEFFIAGRARNRENILKICNIFDKYNISYYCFIKNENKWGFGNENQTTEEKQREFESLNFKSDAVLNLFKTDLEGEKSSKNLLLVLPAEIIIALSLICFLTDLALFNESSSTYLSGSV